MTKSSVAPPKAVALNAETKPFVAPSKASPVLNAEARSFTLSFNTAPVVNVEAMSFVATTGSSAGYKALASPDAFMASARKRLQPAAGTPNTTSGVMSETKSFVAAPKTAPVTNTEAKSFDPAARSTGHYAVLASPEAFMASARKHVNQAAGTPNTTPANTETKSVVETVKTTFDAGIEAKHVADTVKDASVVNPKVSEHAASTTPGDDKTEIKSVVDTAETTSDVNIEAKPTAGTPTARVNTEVTPKDEPVVYTEAISYPSSAASTHWAVLATNKQFMASVRNNGMERENAVARTRNTIVAVANTEVTPNTASGVNPEAKPFVPAGRLSAGSSGLVSNDKFMASARKFMAGGGLALGKYRKSATTSGSSSPAIKPRDAPARVLLFKNVPDWMNISDVLGFVYGGAVDCIFRSNMAEITVQFCEEAACMAYLEAHPNGIRVQHPTMPDEEVTIIVEKAPRGEEVTPALQMKMATGGSRLVRVDGIFDPEKLQALTARAMEYEVDHIMFRIEKDKVCFVEIDTE